MKTFVSKLIVLIILGLIGFALQTLPIVGDSSILVAVGFVILAAYTVSEISSTVFSLPRVSGYMIAGLALGPFGLAILSKEVVQEITIFNTLAIGLIAIAAGLEIHFGSLKKILATILITSAFKAMFLTALVVGAFFGLQKTLGLIALPSDTHALALGLVFAALCLATSPAISFAVIAESKAKGRISQLVLGSAVVKDFIGVVVLALALSYANSVIGGEELGGISYSRLVLELVYSVLAGIGAGLIIILWIKYIKWEMFLFIITTIFITEWASHQLHLELLLVLIVAGMIVRNFSAAHELLHGALVKVSLPVFVVFFTNVTAGLDLHAVFALWPFAVGLFLARTISFFAAHQIACKIQGEKTPIKKYAWLGYLSQSGITLGLIAIAKDGLPEYATVIQNIGLGLVSMNLAAGPLALRFALDRGKETNDDQASTATPTLSNENSKVAEPRKNQEAKEFDQLVTELAARIDDEKIKNQFEKTSSEIFSVLTKQQLASQKSILTAFTNDLNTIYELSETEIVAKLDDHLNRLSAKGRDIYSASTLFVKVIDSTPVVLSAPVHPSAYRIEKSDSTWVRMWKLIRRPGFWFDPKPMRAVPFRKIAKYNLEPAIGMFTQDLIHSWFRLLGLHIYSFQRNLELHTFGEQDILAKIEQQNILWYNNMIADFCGYYRKAASTWIDQLNKINTIYLADSAVRFSHVEPKVASSFAAAKSAMLEWEEKFVFCRNRLVVIVHSALLSNTITKLLDEKFFLPIADAKENADQLVQDVFAFFAKIEAELPSTDRPQKNNFSRMLAMTSDFNRNHLQAELKSKYIRGSFRLLNRDISINLKRSLPKDLRSFQIASEQTLPHQVKEPAEIMVKRINLYELFEQSILINFLPVIEEKIEGVSNYLESLLQEMEQAFSILAYSLESNSQNEGEPADKEIVDSIRATILTERDKIKELYEGLNQFIDNAKDTAEKLVEESKQEVKQGIERFSVVFTARSQFRSSLVKFFELLRHRQHQLVDKLLSVYQNIQSSSKYSLQREIDTSLSAKIASRTLDANTIRQFIQESYLVNYELANLPRVYFRLFNLEPIQDKRFFVAHRELWRHLEPLTQSATNHESLKILALGGRGMGKSSLLNVAQLDVRAERLIRLEDSLLTEPPLLALAKSLGCQQSLQSVLANLRLQSTTVIIDNIELWIHKDRLEDFSEFLEVIKQSSHRCHWLVSMTNCNFATFDKAFNLRSVFNKIIDLELAQPNITKELILSRQRLSGLTVDYPRNFVGEIASRLGISNSDDLYFNLLHERSRGHLRHLISLWLRGLDNSDGRSISLVLDKSVDRGLPFIEDLAVTQRYILGELYRNHRLSHRELSTSLGISLNFVDNDLQYLEYSGLVKSRGGDRTHFELPSHLIFLIGLELQKEGIVYEWSRV